MPNTEYAFNEAKLKGEQACGCLIASNVIALEVQRRKHKLQLDNLRKKITAGSKSEKSKLKVKERDIRKALGEIYKHKKHMKHRFSNYAKKSGYAPPKSRKTR